MTLHVLQKIERDDAPVDFFRRIIGKYRQDEGLWCRFFNFFFGGVVCFMVLSKMVCMEFKIPHQSPFCFQFFLFFYDDWLKKRSAKVN